ncbi:MAG: hypothetical protein ACQGVK_13850 [Myxococcota bacterium]
MGVAVGLRRALVATAAGLVLAAGAMAFVPSAERVERAIAETNSASRRNRPLRLELSLRLAGGEPVARGELVTHPQGLARLELRTARGLVERHVLQGTEHRASRNGGALADPRPFLPPLFLIQAETATTLRAALRSYGVWVDSIGLAPCGLRDCYVVGDPSKVPPPWPGPEGAAATPAAPETAVGLSVPGAPDGPPLAASDGDAAAGAPRTRLWIDIETFDLLRIDFENGVSVRLGPPGQFEKIRFPQWIQIDDPQRGSARLDVSRVAPVAAPAAAFGDAWLFRPTSLAEDADDGAAQTPGSP